MISRMVLGFTFVIALPLLWQPVRTGTLTGRVVDVEGKPIGGTSVLLRRETNWSQGERADAVTVVCDGSGSFRAANLTPGKWTLTWSAKGFYEKFEWAPAGGMSVQRVPTEVKLIPGGMESVQLVMRRQ